MLVRDSKSRSYAKSYDPSAKAYESADYTRVHPDETDHRCHVCENVRLSSSKNFQVNHLCETLFVD